MARSFSTVSGTSITTATTIYTCPANKVAKVILMGATSNSSAGCTITIGKYKTYLGADTSTEGSNIYSGGGVTDGNNSSSSTINSTNSNLVFKQISSSAGLVGSMARETIIIASETIVLTNTSSAYFTIIEEDV